MTVSLGDLAGTIEESLTGITRTDLLEDSLRITTQCLYPSNGFIRVSVKLSGTMIIVSDDRAGLNEAQGAGLDAEVPDRSLRHLVSPYGAEIRDGNVFSVVPIESAATTVILVANASRTVADWMYAHSRIKPTRNFRALLTDLLRQKFETILHHDVEIDGRFKKHKFAHLISLPHGPRIIMDPVIPEPGSFNSRIVAHLDVKALGDKSLEQRMIYDDADRWDPATLNLLSVGAVAIPFSRSGEALERLAARTDA
jgi:hypothetical protein